MRNIAQGSCGLFTLVSCLEKSRAFIAYSDRGAVRRSSALTRVILWREWFFGESASHVSSRPPYLLPRARSSALLVKSSCALTWPIDRLSPGPVQTWRDSSVLLSVRTVSNASSCLATL